MGCDSNEGDEFGKHLINGVSRVPEWLTTNPIEVHHPSDSSGGGNDLLFINGNVLILFPEWENDVHSSDGRDIASTAMASKWVREIASNNMISPLGPKKPSEKTQ